jgi:cardiolipin synthase A/B
MVHDEPSSQVTASRNKSGWHVLACLLLAIHGCQTPPARLAGCDSHAPAAPRRLVYLRQLLAESAQEASHHPLRSGQALACASVDRVDTVERGLVGKRLIMRCMGTPVLLPPCGPALLSGELNAAPTNLSGESLQAAHLELYVDGVQALAALEEVIDRATCRIDVLMFTWDNSFVGKRVAARLAAKAGPHLRVRILVDGGANLVFGLPRDASTAEVNETVCWLARQPYIELLRTRNPFGRHDHRKLVVADGQIAWTGGRNFTERAFVQRHDVSFSLTGPLVGELEERFERFWHDQGGRQAELLPPSPADPSNAGASLVYTEPGEHSLRRAVYEAVDRAQHHIYLENPYLTDNGMIVKLAQARKRGVEVSVVLSLHDETAATSHASRVIATRLLWAGVHVYLYPDLIHTKALAVDGCWAYLGTGNFDRLSLRQDHELGVVIGAGPIIAEVEDKVFRPDFRPEWELKQPLPLSPIDYFYEMVASPCL